MASSHLEHTLLPKILALPVFSSDALSSVAYATEQILVVLVPILALLGIFEAGRQVAAQEFHRRWTSEQDVLCAKHGPHATGAELVQQAVTPEHRPRARCAGAGARNGRCDAESMGHDPAATHTRLRRCLAAGPAVADDVGASVPDRLPELSGNACFRPDRDMRSRPTKSGLGNEAAIGHRSVGLVASRPLCSSRPLS
jgi:hypothetical protein